jgi:hypothetical protein
MVPSDAGYAGSQSAFLVALAFASTAGPHNPFTCILYTDPIFQGGGSLR